MNRRDFIRRGAVGAAATAVVAAPITKAITEEKFPETREEMEAIVNAAKENGKFRWRFEHDLIQDGLSRTDTLASTHWYYHQGGRIAVLHVREYDHHVCFDIENIRDSKTTNYPPLNNGKAL